MLRGHRWERDPDDYGAYPLFHCVRCGKHKKFPMEKALEQPGGLRGGLGLGLGGIVKVGFLCAAIGGVIGLLIGAFASHTGSGFGWGITGVGLAVTFFGGGSGSPSENLVRGRWGASGHYWGESAPQPMTQLDIVLGGALAMAIGFVVLYLEYA
jgi:hypothetical protein